MNEGKQLVVSVSCPELEGQIAKLEEQWLSLNKKIDHELHRLQTLLKHLLRCGFLGIDWHQKRPQRDSAVNQILHAVPLLYGF